jgi:dTDP-4-dehydrorhamnose reductase
MTTRVLIAGSGGQLGRAMADRWPRAGHDVVALAHADLDVTSAADVETVVARIRPHVIVNCAAYTDVDGAERDPVPALAVNAWAAGRLARAAAAEQAVFVHFSTDFVFDGVTSAPYAETDRANPLSAYAASKLFGEWLALDAPRHYVLRVESLFGGQRRHSSVDRLLAALRTGAPVRAFVDRTVSPSFVDDVVAATAALVAREAPFGLYHCVNSGWTTWSGIAHELARIVGAADAQIADIAMADAGLLARRPAFAALSKAKLAAAGIPMPTWQDALARYVSSLEP